MDKPENVSDSRLPSFSQNIKRDCYGKRPISSPYHIFISVLHSEGGEHSPRLSGQGASAADWGRLWKCSPVSAPLFSAHAAWNSHLMQYYASRLAARSNSRSGSQDLLTFAAAVREHTETNMCTAYNRTFKKRCLRRFWHYNLTAEGLQASCGHLKGQKHHGKFVTIKSWLSTGEACQIPKRSIREIQLPSTVQLLSIGVPQNMKSANSIGRKCTRHQSIPELNKKQILLTFLVPTFIASSR